MTSSDNALRSNASSGKYTINYVGMKARLISGQEIADIVKNTEWTTSSVPISIAPSPWLYQNLSSSNTNERPFGYWTDTARTSYSSGVWQIRFDGGLGYNAANFTTRYGIRPVVRILKSNL